MPDACHHDLARVDVIGIGDMQLQLAPRRSAQSCADVQAVSAVGRRSGFPQPSDAQPDLHDAWQDYPRVGRQSLPPVTLIMSEMTNPGKPNSGRKSGGSGKDGARREEDG